MKPVKEMNANEVDWSYRLIRELADESLHIDSSEHAIVLKDRFPKSRRHYLVLPRKEINTVNDLTTADIELLEDMFQLGQRVAGTSGLDIDVFRYGFHVEPHMKRLHLHVISKDFDSPHLKKIKHWNIFNTALFMAYDDVLQELRQYGKIKRRPADHYEKLHNSVMRCNVCTFATDKIWKMKQHIQKHW